MQTLCFIAYLLFAGIVFALAEVQIEGKSGWASALPTWRVDNAWTRVLLGGRPLTGYHLYIHMFVLLLLHAPIAFRMIHLAMFIEMRIFAFLILFWILEDFAYFIFNPAFGLRRFSKDYIWWHPHWWWILPREYWLFAPVGVALYMGSFGIGPLNH